MTRKLFFGLLMATMGSTAQTITHHYDPYVQTVQPQGLLSCNDNGVPFKSSYYTTFHLSNDGYGIEGDSYTISNVEFGVENISGVASYPITVRLYSTLQNFPDGFATLNGYTQLAEEEFQIPAQQLAIYSVPIVATLPTNKILVVEISYEGDPDGEAIVLLGGNAEGSWGSTWTTSEECGVDTPTTMATLAAWFGIEGNFAMVINVIGQGTLGTEHHIVPAMNAYPNPTTGILTLQGLDANDTVKVTDLSGKVLTLNSTDGKVDISALPGGIYYLTIASDEVTYRQKIIKL